MSQAAQNTWTENASCMNFLRNSVQDVLNFHAKQTDVTADGNASIIANSKQYFLFSPPSRRSAKLQSLPYGKSVAFDLNGKHEVSAPIQRWRGSTCTYHLSAHGSRNVDWIVFSVAVLYTGSLNLQRLPKKKKISDTKGNQLMIWSLLIWFHRDGDCALVATLEDPTTLTQHV